MEAHISIEKQEGLDRSVSTNYANIRNLFPL